MPRLKRAYPSARPHRRSETNRKSIAPRGAPGAKRVRSTESSTRAPLVQTFANATTAPSCRTSATGPSARYRGSNQPSENPFSRTFFSASQPLDTPRRTGSSAGTAAAETTSNASPSRSAR